MPLREILGDSTDRRSMTGGEGSYSFEMSDYDIVPANVAKEIRDQFQKQKEHASS